ncbi:hypothetical protein IBE71_10030, partial [Francisella tularensis]|nr:hypothetical protein [Francisella tularensis]
KATLTSRLNIAVAAAVKTQRKSNLILVFSSSKATKPRLPVDSISLLQQQLKRNARVI